MTPSEAEEKVRRGEQDEQYTGRGGLNMDSPFGVRRFVDCLNTILLIHGWEKCLRRMRQLGGEQALIVWQQAEKRV